MSLKELPKTFPIWIKCYKICHHFGPSFAPSSLGLEWVDLWRDFKLDLSHLFYLSKFSLVFHTKCWKGAFCADYEVTHYWIYVTTEYVDPVISRMDQLQENRIFKFLKIYLKNRFLSKSKNFFAEVHCMKYRIRWENKNFDDMGTLISQLLNLCIK